MSFSRRSFLKSAALAGGGLCLPGSQLDAGIASAGEVAALPRLMGNRFITFNTVVRVNQIEVSRDRNDGEDEGAQHTLQAVRAMRDAFQKGFPGGRMTWAFSWLALHDQRANYQDIRRQVSEYHHELGDEVTFIPGGYFAPMYNPRRQVNRDLHDALALVSEMVGGGYRPGSVVGGFLAADNLRYLAQEEHIHVAQGNIWSQYAIDNGDGEGSLCYPYYPSREHFLKPAQGKDDFIDCVNLDGWTVDFLAGRRRGFEGGFNSRMGVGPIETLRNHGSDTGLKQMLATTAVHLDEGFRLNGFAWVTNCWEVSLPIALGGLTAWLEGIRRRWPETLCVTQTDFGLAWRQYFKNNAPLNYRFVQRGTGIGGSDENLEIRWFMNRTFRLALLRDWKVNGPELVIDFTRYDAKAEEPPDAQPDKPARNWSLLNRINQKRTRPQDTPVPLAGLTPEEQWMIRRMCGTIATAS
jgi:hypothetical protein